MESLHEDSWARKMELVLQRHESGGIVFLGIGHPLRSDDYVGSLIAKDLAGKDCSRGRVRIVDAENSPENVLGSISDKASVLVIIDSVDAALPPGSIRFVDVNETTYRFFTSHNIPLAQMLQTGPEAPKALLLGIQPGTLGVGGRLSREVQNARATIVRELCRILKGLGDEPIGS